MESGICAFLKFFCFEKQKYSLSCFDELIDKNDKDNKKKIINKFYYQG